MLDGTCFGSSAHSGLVLLPLGKTLQEVLKAMKQVSCETGLGKAAMQDWRVTGLRAQLLCVCVSVRVCAARPFGTSTLCHTDVLSETWRYVA